MNEALQRQLTNAEPKCANCASWDHEDEGQHIRACLLNPGGRGPRLTTDLAVCSMWSKLEGKPNGQAEAEQAQ